MAAYIVNHILGGGSFSSRLYARCARSAGSPTACPTAWSGSDHAAVVIGGTADARRPHRRGAGDHRAGNQAHGREGPTAGGAGDKAKSYLKGSYALALDTSGKIAAQLMQIQLDKLGIDYIQRRSLSTPSRSRMPRKPRALGIGKIEARRW